MEEDLSSKGKNPDKFLRRLRRSANPREQAQGEQVLKHLWKTANPETLEQIKAATNIASDEELQRVLAILEKENLVSTSFDKADGTTHYAALPPGDYMPQPSTAWPPQDLAVTPRAPPQQEGNGADKDREDIEISHGAENANHRDTDSISETEEEYDADHDRTSENEFEPETSQQLGPGLELESENAEAIGGNQWFDRVARSTRMLDPEQRQQLADRIVEHGLNADKNTLALQSMRSIVGIARNMGRGRHVEDLVNEGFAAVKQAIDQVDPRRPDFPYYAAGCARHAMLRFLVAQNTQLYVPFDATMRRTRVSRAVTILEMRLGREPTLTEIAAQSKLTEHQVLESLVNIPQQVMRPESDDTDALIEDQIEDDPELQPAELAEQRIFWSELSEALKHGFDDRERAILILRYGLRQPLTLEQIARGLGLTRGRISQIEKEALAKLRSWLIGT